MGQVKIKKTLVMAAIILLLMIPIFGLPFSIQPGDSATVVHGSNPPGVGILQAVKVINVKIHIVSGSNITAANITDWLKLAGDVLSSFTFNVTKVNNHTSYNQSANVPNVLNIWAVPAKSWGHGNISGIWGEEIQLPPGDCTNIHIKNSTLAHEIGHKFGLVHNTTDPNNIMHPDNQGEPPTSCHRTGINLTDDQRTQARNSTAAMAHGAHDVGSGTSQWDAHKDVPYDFIDLSFAEVWATDENIYLTLTVDNFMAGDGMLGFYLETDNDPTTGDPLGGLDYYVGFDPDKHVMFGRYDEDWVPLDPMGITYDFALAWHDADLPPIIVGVNLILPIAMLERKAGDLLSFRATGEYDGFVDRLPDEGLSTILYVPEEVPAHDIAITNVSPSTTSVRQGESLNIDVTVANVGDWAESFFDITAYVNTTEIGTQTITSLSSGDSTTLTFPWNTTGFALGEYTISAYANPVPGETNIDNNEYINGTVQIIQRGGFGC